MVMKMNKNDFINTLKEKTELSENDCIIVSQILEEKFFINKKNRDIIIAEIVKKLEISNDSAINIYDTARTIVNDEIKNKIRHPFKIKD